MNDTTIQNDIIKQKNNDRVPIAILSCFLIAFIVQGILKISGVFVFEKALNWEIFKIIDENKILNIAFYSLFSFCTIYCLSFSFLTTSKNCFWQYILILLVSCGVIILRTFVTLTYSQHILVDIIAYVVVPFFIHLTATSKNRIFKNSLFGIITTLSINIILYLAYLGLCYWSSLLNSIILIKPEWLSSSANFLIQSEVYMGLIICMLSTNCLVRYLKRR